MGRQRFVQRSTLSRLTHQLSAPKSQAYGRGWPHQAPNSGNPNVAAPLVDPLERKDILAYVRISDTSKCLLSTHLVGVSASASAQSSVAHTSAVVCVRHRG